MFQDWIYANLININPTDHIISEQYKLNLTIKCRMWLGWCPKALEMVLIMPHNDSCLCFLHVGYVREINLDVFRYTSEVKIIFLFLQPFSDLALIFSQRNTCDECRCELKKMVLQQISSFTHVWELDIFNIKTKTAKIGEILLLVCYLKNLNIFLRFCEKTFFYGYSTKQGVKKYDSDVLQGYYLG